ncbi:MAG: AI-2E family transporter [Candidatus Spyradocola sp.]|nr:AI-2E family transporter [Candidatus Spyradocola sp.]
MTTRWKRALLLLAGIALAVLLRKVLGRIALLLLVSGTLAYLLDPLSRFYRRHTRLAQGPCAALAFASAALALAAFLFFGVPALSRQLTALAQAAPQLVESFGEQLTRMTASLGRAGLPDEAVTVLRAQAARLLDAGAQFLMDRLVTFAKGVSSLGYLVFAPVLAFYMLRDKRRLFSFLTRLIPSSARRSVLRVGLSVRDAVGAYVAGQLMVSFVTGTLTGLGLLLLGIPSWLALGATMMLCNLIPYFGPWLGAIPIVVFCAGRGLPAVLGGVLVVFAAQQIEGLFVSPRLIGEMASLHPALVVLSLIAGGWIAGLPGMFYAVPAAVSLRAALRALRDARLET